MATKYPLLTEAEHARNTVGNDVLLFHSQHPMYEDLAMSWYSKKQGEAKMKLNAKKTEGLSGHVEKNEDYIPQSSLVYPLSDGTMPSIDMDQSMSVIFEMPSSKHVHKSMLLRGVLMPTPELDNGDIQKTRGLASKAGRNFGGAPLDNGGGYRGGRGGNNNRGGGRGGSINYANPFAAHLAFPPGQGPPPPHMAAQQGYAPPPPPGWTPPGGNNYNGGSNYNGGGYNSGGYQNQNQNYSQGYQGGGNQGYGGGRDQGQYGGSQGGYNNGGGRDDYNGNGGGYRGGRGGRGGGGGGGNRDGGGRGRGNYNGNNRY